MGKKVYDPYIRVVSDIHSHLTTRGGRNYMNLIAKMPFSVQLGDLGWHDDGCRFYELMKRVDPTRHRVVPGNHDNYGNLTPHYLGDYGMHTIPLPNDKTFEFFYLRGAQSVDWKGRVLGVSWWPQEELTWEQGREALKEYGKHRPRIVFTHDCPEVICRDVLRFGSYLPSKTHQYLQACLDLHQPELWIFGHHHRDFVHVRGRTHFICLDGKIPSLGHEVSFIDFDYEGNPLTLVPN